MWLGSPRVLANVRGQQCALISYFRWGEPPKPTGEMWCFAPQNHSRFSMTALTVSMYQKSTHTFRFYPFTLHVTRESQQRFNQQRGFYFLSKIWSFSGLLPCNWDNWPHLSPRQGACEQQLSQSDTEWRGADAPLFTAPLTFFLKHFILPSQPICRAWPGGNKWKIVW